MNAALTTLSREARNVPERNNVTALTDLLLESIFDDESSERQLRLTRMLFADAPVVLIPRTRPIFAQTVTIDNFLEGRRGLFGKCNSWRERFRLNESDAQDVNRIHSNVTTLSSSGVRGGSRMFDIFLVVRNVPSTRRITHSITVVYDEIAQNRSPITVFC